jgi:hypothetical protein
MASTISAGLTSGTALNLVGDTSGALQLRTNGTTAALTIDTSQNVGIGTTSPGSYAGFKTLALNGTTGGVVDFLNNGTREGSIYNIGTSFTIKTFTASPILFATNNAATQLTLDTSGNLGLGVTPNSLSGYKGIEVSSGNNAYLGLYAGSYASNTISVLSANGYPGSGGWTYKGNGYATFYQQYSGQHQWYNAASGTAGTAISFTQAMTLDASGNLNITSIANTDSIATINSTSTNVSQRLNFTANGTLQAQLYNDASQTILSSVTSIPILFRTNNTERMRINAGAPILCLSGGNTSATGTGIAFPATQSASSDANTLDDYEEGAWTPTITDGYTRTYSIQAARYIKVGKLVYVFGQIKGSTRSGAAGSYAYIALPFPANDMNQVQQPATWVTTYNVTHTSPITGAPQWDAPSEFRIYETTVNANSSYLAPSGIPASFELAFFFAYTTNS